MDKYSQGKAKQQHQHTVKEQYDYNCHYLQLLLRFLAIQPLSPYYFTIDLKNAYISSVFLTGNQREMAREKAAKASKGKNKAANDQVDNNYYNAVEPGPQHSKLQFARQKL